MDQPHVKATDDAGAGRPLDHRMDDMSTQARQAAATLGEVLEAGIHQRPLAAVAIAVAIGYALGRLIHRRSPTDTNLSGT